MSIKKLNHPIPKDPIPDVYLNREPVSNIEHTEFLKTVMPVDPPLVSLKSNNNIPQSKVHNYNLKKFKSFKNIRKQYKLKNQKDIFLTDMQIVMKEFDTKDFYLDNDLLLHVSNIAEEFFIYGSKTERDQMKDEAIAELMLPYYRNDKQILDIMRVSVWNRVKKTNLFKRLLKRVSNKIFLNLIKKV